LDFHPLKSLKLRESFNGQEVAVDFVVKEFPQEQLAEAEQEAAREHFGVAKPAVGRKDSGFAAALELFVVAAQDFAGAVAKLARSSAALSAPSTADSKASYLRVTTSISMCFQAGQLRNRQHCQLHCCPRRFDSASVQHNSWQKTRVDPV